jgi:hypothetical protein
MKVEEGGEKAEVTSVARKVREEEVKGGGREKKR